MISIGRLDFMSEGLLLFTNNGDYSRNLELPSKGYERIYRVCLRGQIKRADVDKTNKGIKIDNATYEKVKIKIPNSGKVVSKKEYEKYEKKMLKQMDDNDGVIFQETKNLSP